MTLFFNLNFPVILIKVLIQATRNLNSYDFLPILKIFIYDFRYEPGLKAY
jgi:hypothetical protein